MKVLDVTEFYSERGGGVRSHLSLKQHELCQRGHEHVVVAPGGIAREESALAHLVGHARVIRVAGPAMPYDPTYHFLVRVDKIHAIFKAERPDILEIHSPYVAALAALTEHAGQDVGGAVLVVYGPSLWLAGLVVIGVFRVFVTHAGIRNQVR